MKKFLWKLWGVELNKVYFLGVIFVILTIFCGGVFGAVPTLNSVLFPSDYTNSTPAILDIGGDSDTNMCIQKNMQTCTSDWNTFSTTYSAPLAVGDNNYCVQLKHSDGNVSEIKCDNITYDITAPTLTTGTIDPNWIDGTVDLDINCTDFYTCKLFIAGTLYDLNSVTHSFNSDGNHEIYAQDLAGNKSSSKFVLVDDTNGTISTITPTNDSTWYITDINVVTTPSNVGSSMTCYYKIGDAPFANGTTFSLTQTSTVQIYCKDRLDRNTSTITRNYKVDKDAPSVPTNFEKIEEGNGSITLKWTIPAADCSANCSGNNGYKLYYKKNSTSTWDSVRLYSNNVDSVSGETDKVKYTKTGLENGIAYDFQLSTTDNAGLESTKTDTVPGTPQEDNCGCDITVKKNGTTVEYVKPSDVINISCNIEEASDNARIKYKYDSGSTENLTSEEDNTDYVTSSFNVASGHDQVKFWCTWEYNSTDFESSIKTIVIDNTPPTITWNDTNNMFSGSRTISFDAIDDKLVDTVNLYIGTNNLVLTKITNTYSYDFNSEKYSNGTYTLKASVVDEAGNKTEKTRTITIQNILTEGQEKEYAIKDALTKKKVVEDLIKYLEDQGVLISQEIQNKKTIADGLVEDANALSEIAAIKLKTNEAIAIYNEINSELPSGVEIISSRDYEYSLDDVVAILVALGIDQTSAEEAKAIIEQTHAKRTIELIKVGDSYQAKIKITLVNDTNDTIVRIVEIVSKEFANSAALLHSSHPFVVLEDDPIIEFTIDAPIGSAIEFSYGIANLSEESANALMDNNVIASFAAPPIVTGNDATISKILESPNNGFGLLLSIIVIVIILLVIAGAGAFTYLQYNKNSTPSFGAQKKGITNKIKAKVKKDSGNAPNKWKYKG